LRFSRFFDAEDGYENSRNEQQKPHRQLLLTPAEKRQPDAFSGLGATKRFSLLLLARSGHSGTAVQSPLSGVKRTSQFNRAVSVQNQSGHLC
jgi:hypothetical protein